MDIQTLLVIGTAILLAALMAMLVALRTRKTYPGFGWWTAGLACEVLGTSLFLLRFLDPRWSNGVITSALLVISLIFIGRGMLAFRGRQISFGLEVVLLLSYLALFGFFSVIHSNANARVAMYSLYLGLGSLLTVYWCLGKRPAYFGSSDVALAAGLSIQGVAAVARAVYSLGAQPEVINHMLDSHYQGYFLLIQVVTAMLLPLAFISMNASRIEFDYRSIQEKLQDSLTHSERLRAQMVAFNEMNERLLACSQLNEARAVIARSLVKVFGADRAVYIEYGETPGPEAPTTEPDTARLAASSSHGASSLHLPLRTRDRTLGELRVRVDDSLPSGELESVLTLTTTVSESIKLALSHLQLQEELRTQALRDSLTGLFNRRYLDDVLPRELERCRRQGETLTAAMLDIDHFKQVNDTFGHEAGDEVLRSLGQLLLQWSRSSDIACRYGGEEFTLILQGAAPDDMTARLEELLQRVAQLQIRCDGRILPRVTVSIGMAQTSPETTNAAALLSRADNALYQAKQEGRNRMVMATADAVEGFPQPLPG